MRVKKWLAAVLGLPTGQHITVPTGAVLIMPVDAAVDTVNVAGGNVYWDKTIDGKAGVIEKDGKLYWNGPDAEEMRRRGKYYWAGYDPSFERHFSDMKKGG